MALKDLFRKPTPRGDRPATGPLISTMPAARPQHLRASAAAGDDTGAVPQMRALRPWVCAWCESLNEAERTTCKVCGHGSAE